VIRLATTDDVEGLAKLWLEMAAEGGYEEPDGEGWAKLCRAGLGDGTLVAAVLDRDGELGGFADAILTYEPASREVLGLGRHGYMQMRYRGKGFGRAMVIKMSLEAMARGATVLVTHGGMTRHVLPDIFGHEMTEHVTLYQIRVGG